MATHSCKTALFVSSFSGTIDAPVIIPGTAIEIAKVLDIQLPGVEATVVDRSWLNETNCVKRSMPGNIDPGELTFTIEWEFSQDAALRALLRQFRFFQIRMPNPAPNPPGNEGAIAVFGFLKMIGIEIPADDRITAPVAIHCDGLPFPRTFN